MIRPPPRSPLFPYTPLSRSADRRRAGGSVHAGDACAAGVVDPIGRRAGPERPVIRSEEHTSELQSLRHLVCRLLLEKKKKKKSIAQRNTPGIRLSARPSLYS